jgi:bifunctional DNA-binding transcriptional regulator/antitoxin component of YhaV-PrlF toxin-antitoxin module
MTTVVLSDEGQVQLPADLRRRLGLDAGGDYAFFAHIP